MNKKDITLGDITEELGEEAMLVINYKKLQEAKKSIALHPATKHGIPVFDADLGIVVYEVD